LKILCVTAYSSDTVKVLRGSGFEGYGHDLIISIPDGAYVFLAKTSPPMASCFFLVQQGSTSNIK